MKITKAILGNTRQEYMGAAVKIPQWHQTSSTSRTIHPEDWVRWIRRSNWFRLRRKDLFHGR